jgi:imidazolonepropionase-like amidohydrolase
MKRVSESQVLISVVCLALLIAGALLPMPAAAGGESRLVFRNVNIFDGRTNKLHSNRHVLVEGNLIQAVSADPIDAGDAKVIEGDGRTLMPGLIDGHAHIMINAHFDEVERNMDPMDLSIRSVKVVERFLMDGFTTVRDMGGPLFATRRSVEEGLIPGPRLYPSGAFLSQTSGHGDFRDRADAGFSPKDPGTCRILSAWVSAR